MGILRQIGKYLWLVKKDPDDPQSKFLGYMHFINRLSLILFIVALIIMLVRLFR